MPVTIDTTANTLNMNDMNTPIKSSSNNSKNAISTPDTLNDSFESSSSASSCSDNETDTDTDSDIVSDLKALTITDHKRLELEGKIKEPLLEENPGRFVLFPIQNPEVRFLYNFLFFMASDLRLLNRADASFFFEIQLIVSIGMNLMWRHLILSHLI